MRFNIPSYRSLPPRPFAQRVFGELGFVRHAPTRMFVKAINPIASGGCFHLRYEGISGLAQSDDPHLFAVNLVRSDGSPALTGHYFVDMMPQSDLSPVEEHFVASG